MDRIIMRGSERVVVRIRGDACTVRSSGFWIKVEGRYDSPEEVLVAFDEQMRALEEELIAVLDEADAEPDSRVDDLQTEVNFEVP